MADCQLTDETAGLVSRSLNRLENLSLEKNTKLKNATALLKLSGLKKLNIGTPSVIQRKRDFPLT